MTDTGKLSRWVWLYSGFGHAINKFSFREIKGLILPFSNPLFGGILLMLFSCRTPFEPEVPENGIDILVVEGFLDSDGKKSELKLSRMTELNSSSSFSPEGNAIVKLVSSTGTDYHLEEQGNGLYLFEHLLPLDLTYQLEIELQNGERYQSDVIVPIDTPEILETGFVQDEEGVEVFVNTKGNDQADNFLWTFEETWIFRPYTQVGYIFDSLINDVRERKAEEQIYTCFRSEPNPGILLETSSRFQEQVVFRQTITEIPVGDQRLQARYSILISQMAIPSDAVGFWEVLKKNTEDIGSIFSPLPSLISGNLNSVDGKRPVVGQVNLGRVRQQRLYIDRQEISPWPYVEDLFEGCIVGPDPVLIGTFEFLHYFGTKAYLPARAFMGDGDVPAPGILGYYPIETRCGDCSLYADITKPDFWEDD